MLRGMQYTANGLENKARAMEIIANNLANVSSAGFKRSAVFSESLQNSGASPQTESTPIELIDFAQGRLQETGNKLDLAIEGPGFFTVQTEQGLRYTRQGHFVPNPEGLLATANGDLVLGQSGPISVALDSSIAEDGSIHSNDGVVDKLAIVQVTDSGQLRRAGNGYFQAVDDRALTDSDASVRIRTGFLEESNVDALEEMANMIDVYRQFEANQKALRAQDETLEKAVNQVGRV